MIHIMNEKSTSKPRLQQEHARQTRELILEGLVRTMARGIATLSIPAVAREAGVSIPTVYRYFRTKRELIEALGGYLLEKSGIKIAQLPRSPRELALSVREVFLRLEGLDETIRAASVSELGKELRKEGIPMRLKVIENALAPVAAQFNETDWRHLCNIVLVLTSSAMVRVFKDYLDLAGGEAADTVTWAILTLARATSQTNETTQ